MRRKAGRLVDLEVRILERALELNHLGTPEFYGLTMVRALKERGHALPLMGQGTLYKALGRLKKAGLLEARWEPIESASAEGRPPRRFYRITGEGEAALHRA